MGAIVVVALQLAAGGAAPHPASETGRPLLVVEGARVRAVGASIQRLIERGLAESGTFRRVVAEFEQSDVVVHLVHAWMPTGVRGYLNHRIVVSKGVRYLRIQLDARGTEPRVIALIAHELQHALEVARSPEVGRTRDVESFFRSIADIGGTNGTRLETYAAVDVQSAVAQELERTATSRRPR